MFMKTRPVLTDPWAIKQQRIVVKLQKLNHPGDDVKAFNAAVYKGNVDADLVNGNLMLDALETKLNATMVKKGIS